MHLQFGFFSVVCLFLVVHFLMWIRLFRRCGWPVDKRGTVRTHTLLPPMCIKNDLVSKCWRGRAGDYFDVRESSKFMNVMHTDKRHTLAHRIWMHNVRICDALLRARCEMCFCIHLVCVCVCALSPIQHLSIRPFVRCECIFGSARWFSVYEFYLKMVMINDYLFLSIMELWFRHVRHYAHTELAVWRTHVAYVTRRLHHGHADILHIRHYFIPI